MLNNFKPYNEERAELKVAESPAVVCSMIGLTYVFSSYICEEYIACV